MVARSVEVLIRIKCPGCGKDYRVRAYKIIPGLRMTCKQCQTPFYFDDNGRIQPGSPKRDLSIAGRLHKYCDDSATWLANNRVIGLTFAMLLLAGIIYGTIYWVMAPDPYPLPDNLIGRVSYFAEAVYANNKLQVRAVSLAGTRYDSGRLFDSLRENFSFKQEVQHSSGYISLKVISQSEGSDVTTIMLSMKIPLKSFESDTVQYKTLHRLLLWRRPDPDQPNDWYLDATKTLEMSRGPQSREGSD